MKFNAIILLLVLALIFSSGCLTKDPLDTPDGGDLPVEPVEPAGDHIITTADGSTCLDNDFDDICDEQLVEEILFAEDFSGDLAQWALNIPPSVESGSLTSKDLSISTLTGFSSQNGLALNFSVKLNPSNAYGNLRVKLVDKASASNEANVEFKEDGTAIYYIKGSCVPTPQVATKSLPADGQFHSISFLMHTDGSAEWLLDGVIQLQKSEFDVGGAFTLFLSGSTSFGAEENFLFLDDITLTSLAEKEAGFDICPPKTVTRANNPCPAGQCLSNGICCDASKPYYCNGVCYASRNTAMSVSQGQCTEWQVVC